MIGVDKIEDIRRRARGGEPIASIARAVGVSEPTARKYARMEDLSPEPPKSVDVHWKVTQMVTGSERRGHQELSRLVEEGVPRRRGTARTVFLPGGDFGRAARKEEGSRPCPWMCKRISGGWTGMGRRGRHRRAPSQQEHRPEVADMEDRRSASGQEGTGRRDRGWTTRYRGRPPCQGSRP